MLSLQIYDKPNGQILADWSADARGTQLRTGVNGFVSLTTQIALPFREAARWFGRSNLHVEVRDHAGRAVWDGRLEDVKLVDGGIQIVALGYGSALSDNPYTARWSSTRPADWYQADQSPSSDYKPEGFAMSNTNGLFIAFKKNEAYTIWRRGGWMLRVPSRSLTKLQRIAITYSAYLPAGAKIRITRVTYPDSGQPTSSEVWSDSFAVEGGRSGLPQTVLLSSADAVIIELFLDSTTELTTPRDTGSWYLRVTDVRVTAGGATISPSEIAADLLRVTPSLSASSARIQPHSFDVADAVYTDQYPAAILGNLAALADNGNRRWEAAVWDGRMLTFRPQGSGRTWHVELDTSLEAERSLSRMRNAIYAVVPTIDGQITRLPTVSDVASQARYGLTRTAPLSVTQGANTTTQTQAALNDQKEIRTRAALPIARVLDKWGNEYPKYVVRANDTVVLPQLSPILGDALAQIRSSRITDTLYSVDDDTLEITPAEPLPSLETFLQR